MPITEELKNVRKFESVGFSHEQAETLAESIEEAQSASHESLKEFIRNEFEDQNKEFDNKINGLHSEINGLRGEMASGLNSLRGEMASEINGLRGEMASGLNSLELRIDVKLATLKTDITNLKADIMASQKDLLLKIFAIITGVVGMAVTILKLFP